MACYLSVIAHSTMRKITGKPVYHAEKKSRWLLLKREENLKTEQRFRLRDLLRYNLKTVRAYLLKEAFQQLWDYNSPAWAGKFLDRRFLLTNQNVGGKRGFAAP